MEALIDNIQKTWNLDDVWSEVSLIMELWVVVVWGVSVGNFKQIILLKYWKSEYN